MYISDRGYFCRSGGILLLHLKEVSSLEGKKFDPPEILRIKGYKYRAKMLIAGAVLLLAVILILSLIIHGISSAVKSHSKKNDSDTDAAASVVSSQTASVPVVSSMPEVVSKTESTPAPVRKEEQFNADGKLVIDTDTLDGKKAVAVTFDDGPSEYTAQLVAELDKRGAKATFFMVGQNVSQYPEAVNAMVNGGHQLGNHTYDHTNIAEQTSTTINDTIARTDSELLNVCGQKSTAFRPPYGSYTEAQAKAIDKTFTLWSLDTLDWKSRNAEKVKNIIVEQARDGSIILLHDLYKTSVDGVLEAIDELKEKGFEFVTVDTLMTRYGYAVNPGAHSAQYAVYETNSPHASEYKADEERDRQKDAAASQAANTFYYDRRDSDSDEDSDTTVSEKSTSSMAVTDERDEHWDDDEYWADEEYYWDEENNEVYTSSASAGDTASTSGYTSSQEREY